MTEALRELPLRCRCGHVRGVANEVTPRRGFRFVCYCRDCQVFARFLERPDVLDTAGGTDIFQMPTGCVKLTTGSDAVRCLHLSSRIFRWYADCCRTPIGNTAGPRFLVVGLIHSFMDHDAGGHSRDEVLGAPLCRIFERSAVGPLPPRASLASPLCRPHGETSRLVDGRARLAEPSSTILRALRSPRRAFLRRASALPCSSATPRGDIH